MKGNFLFQLFQSSENLKNIQGNAHLQSDHLVRKRHKPLNETNKEISLRRYPRRSARVNYYEDDDVPDDDHYLCK